MKEIVVTCREYEVNVEYSYSLFHEGVASIPAAWHEAEGIRRFDAFTSQPLFEREVLAAETGSRDLSEMEHLNVLAKGLYERLCEQEVEDLEVFFEKVMENLVYGGRHSVQEIFRRVRLMMFFLHMYLEQDPAFASVRGRVMELDDLENMKSESELRRFLMDITSCLLEGRAQQLNRAMETADRAKRFIDAHLTDINLSVTSVASELGVNPNTLSGRFKRLFGISIADYIHMERVEMAIKLLTTTKQPLAEICRRCGYGSVNTLYRAFEKYKGRSPSAYRI